MTSGCQKNQNRNSARRFLRVTGPISSCWRSHYGTQWRAWRIAMMAYWKFSFRCSPRMRMDKIAGTTQSPRGASRPVEALHWGAVFVAMQLAYVPDVKSMMNATPAR